MKKMKTFRLTSPHMHGCKHLQQDVNAHLHSWGVRHGLLKIDNEFGPLTNRRVRDVCFGLGLQAEEYVHGITPAAQARLHNYHRLSPAEKRRERGRRKWRSRYVWRLNGGGPGHAVDFALRMAQTHVVEHPPGSNLGPHITNWERMAGYKVPVNGQGVFWCGCFVNACLVAGGLPSQASWGIGYVPYIEAHAQGHRDGWRWYGPDTTPQRGWIATFGHSIGEHTEFVVANGHPLRTVGGNTSKGNGSPNNGGGVYYHDFASYSGFPLRGFAAPDWHN